MRREQRRGRDEEGAERKRRKGRGTRRRPCREDTFPTCQPRPQRSEEMSEEGLTCSTASPCVRR
eukprot:768072-Hanusia_phi.AAC.4